MIQLDLNKIVYMTVLVVCSLLGHSQDPVTLQFTGKDQYGQYVPLSSVTVENVTRHWQEMLYYPDTTLFIGQTGIEEIEQLSDGVRLFQNVPNPFDGVTDFVLYLPEASAVLLEICDMNGIVTATYSGSLDPGSHRFRSWLSSPQTYLLNARTDSDIIQIKMVNAGRAGQNRLEYLGKGSTSLMEKVGNDDKGSTDLPFNYGDWMIYVGDAHLAGTDFSSDPVLQTQNSSELITLPFNLPLPTVTTEAASNITPTSARLNGSVVEVPNFPVSERGFLLTDNDQLIGATDYVGSAGNGSFHSDANGLQMGTRYYYRAYAKTVLGTTLGDMLYFDTQSDLPEVHTLMVTDTGTHWANCGGNVTYDGGSAVTARGVCWNTEQNPTVNNNHTTNGNGTGSFTSHIVGLNANTTYYVRAYATNSVGTAYGEERYFTTAFSANSGPFYCGIDSVTDFDGNVYLTVEIGQQCWMKENLRTTHYEDGTAINPTLYISNYSNSITQYGHSYKWAAIMHGEDNSNTNPSEVQGICPSGWHVPSAAELTQLTDYVGSHSQYYCYGDSNHIAKALASSYGWLQSINDIPCSPGFNMPFNNSTGFSASAHNGLDFHLWSTTQVIQIYDTCSYDLEIYHNGDADLKITPQYNYYSVRCLLDSSGVNENNAILPVVNIDAVNDVTSTTAVCRSRVSASGGAEVTARGICWSTSPSPTVNDSHTTDDNGIGGFVSNMTGLTPGTNYYVRAYAINSVGISYSAPQIFSTTYSASAGNNLVLIDAQSCPGNDSLTDYDGNTYHTVQIGQQCWMKENLRTTHYSDGTYIGYGYGTSESIPLRYPPADHLGLIPFIGYFYNWAAVMHNDTSSTTNPSGVQGVCPNGWHLPSYAEWTQLTTYVNSINQYQCSPDSNSIIWALVSPSAWCSSFPFYLCGTNNTVIDYNATGFSAYLAGYFSTYFYGYNQVAYFWTSTQNTTNTAHIFKLSCTYSHVNFSDLNIEQGASVRCLRD